MKRCLIPLLSCNTSVSSGCQRRLFRPVLLALAALACACTLAPPALATEPPGCEEMPTLSVRGATAQAPNTPDWIEACYRGTSAEVRNPHRGFRLDLEVRVKEISKERVDALAEELTTEAEPFGNVARVTQVHFDLQDYLDVSGEQPPTSLRKDRTVAPNGRTAIQNMQLVFDRLESLGYTVVLGFTYDRDYKESEKAQCGTTHPSYDVGDIEAHLADLKDLLAANAGLITSWEAGFLGNWGEWGPSCTMIHERDDELSRLMNAIVAAAPPGVSVMMRYPYDRARVADVATRRTLGFHNNYFAAGYWKHFEGGGNSDHYNPYNPFSDPVRTKWIEIGRYFKGVVDASPRLMLDAEMAYNVAPGQQPYSALRCAERPAPEAPTDTPYHPNLGLNGFVAAQRLQSMHYTTMSRTHNRNTFSCWQNDAASLMTRDTASGAGLPFDEAYFSSARTAYDYIRDHLGYRLRLTDAAFGKDAGASLPVKLSIVNDGFSAPHTPRTAYLVLLDEQDEIVSRTALEADWTSWQGACSTEYEVTPGTPGKWLESPPKWSYKTEPCRKPPHTVEGALPLTRIPAGTYSLGLWLPDPDPRRESLPRYAVRLANGNTRWSESAGVNVIATVKAPSATPESPGR